MWIQEWAPVRSLQPLLVVQWTCQFFCRHQRGREKKKKNNPTRIYVQNRKLSHWNLSSNEDPKKQARHFFFFCTVFGKAGHRYVTSVLLKLQCAFWVRESELKRSSSDSAGLVWGWASAVLKSSQVTPRLPIEVGNKSTGCGRRNSTLSKWQARSTWKETQNSVLLRKGRLPEQQTHRLGTAPGCPHAQRGLTPGSAARSAAVSAPPGTRASPPQQPPWPAPRRTFRRIGATAPRSGCTCGGGGGGGAGLRAQIAGPTQPASPQRRLPGGERAAARSRPGGVSVSSPGLCLSADKGGRREPNCPSTLLLVGVARCVSLSDVTLKIRAKYTPFTRLGRNEAGRGRGRRKEEVQAGTDPRRFESRFLHPKHNLVSFFNKLVYFLWTMSVLW